MVQLIQTDLLLLTNLSFLTISKIVTGDKRQVYFLTWTKIDIKSEILCLLVQRLNVKLLALLFGHMTTFHLALGQLESLLLVIDLSSY